MPVPNQQIAAIFNEVAEILGMSFILLELREGRGEIEAAWKNNLPRGWIEDKDVLNTRPLAEVRKMLSAAGK